MTKNYTTVADLIAWLRTQPPNAIISYDGEPIPSGEPAPKPASSPRLRKFREKTMACKPGLAKRYRLWILKVVAKLKEGA
jgi:sulfur carrier protein ThiS